jgi:MFS transporter, DHA2 family, multidrug resistance protein
VSDAAATAARRPASLAPALHTTAPPAPLATRPWIGILAVLCGAFISTVTARLSTFGLADIRGAVHAGFDEGAWITTAQTCAQMLIGPPAVWLGMTFGPRRVLVVSSLTFAAAAILLPFSPNLPVLLGFQALSGLASGTFIPLTISFVLRNLQPRYWAFGIAAYALNLELSLNISATLEGYYVEHLSWRWIFWQSVPLAALMAWCIHRGIPKEPVNWQLARTGDWFGMASLSIGLAMAFAALDQGNRLDWLGSGLVVGLLAGGGLLVAAFLVHERFAASPWINLGFAVRGPIPLLMLLVSLLRLAILSTALLLPQFLSTVQGYRALETGPALLAIAAPQLVIAPFAGLLLRRLDARLPMATGFALVGLACWLVADGLTRDWVTADFLPSQAMQAVGQTLAMSSLVFFAVLNLKPADAMTFGALLQTARLFGAEIGTAVISTFLRVREQVTSNLIGLHVQSGTLLTAERLQAYAAAVQARSPGSAGASARATGLLAQAVRTQANVQSYIDGFALVALVMMGALVLVALLGPAPQGPASPIPLRRNRAVPT